MYLYLVSLGNKDYTALSQYSCHPVYIYVIVFLPELYSVSPLAIHPLVS